MFLESPLRAPLSVFSDLQHRLAKLQIGTVWAQRRGKSSWVFDRHQPLSQSYPINFLQQFRTLSIFSDLQLFNISWPNLIEWVWGQPSAAGIPLVA